MPVDSNGVTYNNKVHGRSRPGEFVGRNLDFYSVSVTEDIRSLGTTGASAASQARFDKVIEVIALNGQPILLAAPTGSGPYVLKFAIEHEGSWFDAASLNKALLDHAQVTAVATINPTI